MMPGQDLDNYIIDLTRLRKLQIEAEEPITDSYVTDIVLKGLTEEYWDVTLVAWKYTDFDLPIIQSVLRQLYLHGLSQNKTGRFAGRGTFMTEAKAPPHFNVSSHNCGK